MTRPRPTSSLPGSSGKKPAHKGGAGDQTGAAFVLSTGTLPQVTTESAAEKPVRPRTVDYALYAIAARCVFSLLAAFALYGERDEISKTARKHNPTWSDSMLHDRVSSAIRSNLIQTLIVIAILLLLGKMIRDGRGWSRWVYTIVSFFPLGDVFKVTGFFASGHVVFKVPYGLTGLAAIVSIALLFVRPSIAYFKPAGTGRVSPFAGFLKPRIPPAAQPESTPAPTTSVTAAKRPAPRAKSRKASTE
jgi:hypothetical protein